MMRGGQKTETKPLEAGFKFVVNINNTDNSCFEWCVKLDYLIKTEKIKTHKERLTQINNNYSSSAIDFSTLSQTEMTSFQDIVDFLERNKKLKVTIDNKDREDVFSEEGIHFNNKALHDINLYYQNEHYMLITDIGAFMLEGLKHKYICRKCKSASFETDEARQSHLKVCGTEETAKVSMPKLGKDGKPPIIKFDQFKAMVRKPFAIYADFESNLVKPAVEEGESTGNTQILQNHVAATFMIVISPRDDIKQAFAEKYPLEYRYDCQTDTLTKFYECLREITKNISTFLINRNKKFRHTDKMIITTEQNEYHFEATQ
eukprot:TRINITY_DN6092_c0_g1_i4.p1 TRINITY_DN6092_c0_g1~~TRINITY_DN6092_c0_g1_i4.p1  ORF type:complete len:324 (+),score=-37.49 TRINITY_DN6092_c0_g1_i4:23-973(+)